MKPSRPCAPHVVANTCRTSPGREPPTTLRCKRPAGGLADGVRHVEHGVRRPLATLSGPGTARALEREHVRPRDVATWTKSRSWPPSSKTCGALAALERAAEDARDAGVRRVAGHPRSVDVVVAQRGDGDVRVFARVRVAEMLLVELRRGVDVAGVERRVLGNASGSSASPHVRARRFEAAEREVGVADRGPGRTRPCRRSGSAPSP